MEKVVVFLIGCLSWTSTHAQMIELPEVDGACYAFAQLCGSSSALNEIVRIRNQIQPDLEKRSIRLESIKQLYSQLGIETAFVDVGETEPNKIVAPSLVINTRIKVFAVVAERQKDGFTLLTYKYGHPSSTFVSFEDWDLPKDTIMVVDRSNSPSFVSFLFPVFLVVGAAMLFRKGFFQVVR